MTAVQKVAKAKAAYLALVKAEEKSRVRSQARRRRAVSRLNKLGYGLKYPDAASYEPRIVKLPKHAEV